MEFNSFLRPMGWQAPESVFCIGNPDVVAHFEIAEIQHGLRYVSAGIQAAIAAVTGDQSWCDPCPWHCKEHAFTACSLGAGRARRRVRGLFSCSLAAAPSSSVRVAGSGEHHPEQGDILPIRRIPASGAVIKKADAMTALTRETTAIATCVEMFFMVTSPEKKFYVSFVVFLVSCSLPSC